MPYRKKIALVFPKDSESFFNEQSTLTFGGANVQMFLIGQELSDRHDFNTFFLINDYQQVDNAHFDKTIIRTFQSRDNILSKILKFHKALSTLKPDFLVQRGLTHFSCFLALYCRMTGIQLVFMFAHDREAKGRLQKNNRRVILFRILLSFSTRIICQNEEQFSFLPNKFKRKATVIYSGYNIKAISYKKTGRDIILWVGRLVSWKRAELFVKLAELNPDYHFVMIAPEVPHEKEYASTIYSLAGMVQNLQLIQFVPFVEVETYFKRSLLFVNTSIEEGFPNTFIQAMKNMVPILSLNVNPDHFLSRFNCGLFCNNSFMIMNRSFKKILRNHGTHKNMAENGYKYVCNNHDIKKVVNSIISFISLN
jgi:glycosyltransferase involved in cell wall biosynthesis